MAQGSTADQLNKALETGGNLDQLVLLERTEIVGLLVDIRTELRIQTTMMESLVRGRRWNDDAEVLRNDAYFNNPTGDQ